MDYNAEIVKNTPTSLLGESPVWHPNEKLLYWVDITGKKLFRYNIEKEEIKTFITESMIGSVAPAAKPYSIITALETGIYGVTLTGKWEKLSEYPGNEMKNNRFNDGSCDPSGRFWIGTMNKKVVHHAGNLYSFDGNKLELKQSGVTISNGIAWSADGEIMYYIDTYMYAVFAFDFDKYTGEISNQRIVIQIPQKFGAPDGMTIDSEGRLWIAHWGGFAVRCWVPETGRMVEKINIPVANVTSCTFGGAELNTLYITTACEGLNNVQQKYYPHSGRLFKTKLDVKGLPGFLFKKIM